MDVVTTTVKYLERILPCSLTGGVKARTSCVLGSTFRSPAKINKPEGLPGVCPILPSVHPALEDEDESATIKEDTYTAVAHKLLKFLHVIQVLIHQKTVTPPWPLPMADLEGVPWVPWNSLLKSCLRMCLVSVCKCNYVHYGPHSPFRLTIVEYNDK